MTRVPGGGGPDGLWWVAFETGKSRDEDGEWVCWARIRPATNEELVEVLDAREKKALRKAWENELEKLVRNRTNFMHQAPTTVGREIILHQGMAGGSRYIVTPSEVWLVESSYDDGPHYWMSKSDRAMELAQLLLEQK